MSATCLVLCSEAMTAADAARAIACRLDGVLSEWLVGTIAKVLHAHLPAGPTERIAISLQVYLPTDMRRTRA